MHIDDSRMITYSWFILVLLQYHFVIILTANNGIDQCVKSVTIINESLPVHCSGELIFNEEFDGSELDTSEWNVETKNNQSSYSLDNENLILRLSGKKTNIALQSDFTFKYGRVEIRAEVPSLRKSPVGWGFYVFGKNHGISLGHAGSKNETEPRKMYFGFLAKDWDASDLWDLELSRGFHIFSLDWREDKMIFKIDDITYKTINEEDYPLELEKKYTISMAMGTEYDSESIDPLTVSQLAVDYIRIYSIGSEEFPPTKLTTKKPNDSLTHQPTPPSQCKESHTSLWPAPARSICQGELIFEELFNGELNNSRWMHEVRAPDNSKNSEFVLYDGRAKVEDGNLVIKPILWSEYQPDLDITSSKLDLSDRCTGLQDVERECHLQASGPIIMPPVVAPRLSTKESFSFKFGRIEIRAKFPRGDWLVPLLLLEPLLANYGLSGYDSGQLRVAMARGNERLRLPQGKFIDGRTLFGGAVLSTDAQSREDFFEKRRNTEHYGKDFHIYQMEWSSEGLQVSVDGNVYGTLQKGFASSDLNPKWRRGGEMAPFNQLFYITLGISVGGFGDFIDNLQSSNYRKPWKNNDPKAKRVFWQDMNNWYPTWQQPELLIDYIRVYAI